MFKVPAAIRSNADSGCASDRCVDLASMIGRPYAKSILSSKRVVPSLAATSNTAGELTRPLNAVSVSA